MLTYFRFAERYLYSVPEGISEMKSPEVHHVDEFVGGWFLGDFLPSLLRTTSFEVGLKTHKKGEQIASHRHNLLTEYTVVVKGRILINGRIMQEKEVFVLYPREGVVAEPLTEEVWLICVKVPSIPSDKEIL